MEYSIILATLVRKKRHIAMVEKCVSHIKTFSKDYELIIVDDCSPLHQEFLKEEADVYIRHEGGNKGCAVGWNDGLKAASGKWLVAISDDVFVNEGWLEAMKEALEEKPNALASMPGVSHMPMGQGIEEIRTWIPACCFMLSKERWEQFKDWESKNTDEKQPGYFDEQFHPFNYEDVDYWTRVFKSGHTIVRNYSVQVRHDEGQVIHSIENNGEVDAKNRERYITKWGFDPIPILYHGAEKFPWEK